MRTILALARRAMTTYSTYRRNRPTNLELYEIATDAHRYRTSLADMTVVRPTDARKYFDLWRERHEGYDAEVKRPIHPTTLEGRFLNAFGEVISAAEAKPNECMRVVSALNEATRAIFPLWETGRVDTGIINEHIQYAPIISLRAELFDMLAMHAQPTQ